MWRRVSCLGIFRRPSRRRVEMRKIAVASRPPIKISLLKNPGALSRGHLINNGVEKSARRCSLGERNVKEGRRAAQAKSAKIRPGKSHREGKKEQRTKKKKGFSKREKE